jgi:hypothetical protein
VARRIAIRNFDIEKRIPIRRLQVGTEYIACGEPAVLPISPSRPIGRHDGRSGDNSGDLPAQAIGARRTGRRRSVLIVSAGRMLHDFEEVVARYCNQSPFSVRISCSNCLILAPFISISFATSAASNLSGICWGQFASQASTWKMITCSGLAP